MNNEVPGHDYSGLDQTTMQSVQKFDARMSAWVNSMAVIDRPFVSSDYWAGTGKWTVIASNVEEFWYCVLPNKVMFMSWRIGNSTLSLDTTYIYFKLPNGYRSSRKVNALVYSDDPTDDAVVAAVFVDRGSDTVEIRKMVGQYHAGTGNIWSTGQAFIPLQ